MDDHKSCTLVPLLTEKEERVDKGQELKKLCEQVDVEAALKRLAGHQVTSLRLKDEVEQDRQKVLQRIETVKQSVRCTLPKNQTFQLHDRP
jgi:hypothetical protein